MKRPLVIKLGGRALEGPGAERELAGDLARRNAPVVLVHGGGAEVTTWCDRLGIASRFVDGLRVTDEATIDVAAAVLAGLANARLVARLHAAGVNAVGVSGASGGLVALDPHPRADTLGAVGTVTGVRPALLHALIDGGFVPVVASLGARRGALLNVNADEMAGALAAALAAPALLLLTDVPGVRLGDVRQDRLGLTDVEAALAGPHVSGGMIPKLTAAAHAVRHGAGRAVIGAWNGPGSLDRLLAADPDATVVAWDGAFAGAGAADDAAGSAT